MLHREKQSALADSEISYEIATKELQAIDAALSEIKNQLRQKSEQVRCKYSHGAFLALSTDFVAQALDTDIKRGLEESGGSASDPRDAIAEAEGELAMRKG